MAACFFVPLLGCRYLTWEWSGQFRGLLRVLSALNIPQEGFCLDTPSLWLAWIQLNVDFLLSLRSVVLYLVYSDIYLLGLHYADVYLSSSCRKVLVTRSTY